MVQAVRINASSYKPVTRVIAFNKNHRREVFHSRPAKLALKASFQASLERAQINQKFWDDLLDKLRKSGGGGGGGSFDRVKVSMQLMDFLSNKALLAMLENLKTTNVLPEIKTFNFSKINTSVLNLFTPFFSTLVNTVFIPVNKFIQIAFNSSREQVQNLYKKIESVLVILSAQMHKTYEVFEKKVKKLLKKILKKSKDILSDIFVDIVEMKNEVLNYVSFIFQKMLKL